MKTTKYHNKRTEYKGISYASRHEALVALQLDIMFAAGEIVDWWPHPKLEFGILDERHVYTFDFGVRFPDEHVEFWEAKGKWAAQDLWRLKACRNYYKELGTPLIIQVIYMDKPTEVINDNPQKEG